MEQYVRVWPVILLFRPFFKLIQANVLIEIFAEGYN